MDDLLRELTERPVRKAAVDRLRAARREPSRLLRLAFQMIEAAVPHAGAFVGAIYSWLPDEFLGELASAAVTDRSRRENPAADEIIQCASLQAPATLSAYLRQLWEIDPNRTSYYRAWPWRAADEHEVQRLFQIFGSSRDKNERRRALQCLLQTRRQDVAQLVGAVDPFELQLVGLSMSDGRINRIAPAEVWHLAFPSDVLRQWESRVPFRSGNRTWVALDTGEPSGTVGGLGPIVCPQCEQATHRLIHLRRFPPQVGVASRPQLGFVWCGWCSCFSEVTYLRFDNWGQPQSMALDHFFDTGNRPSVDPFPPIAVGLVTISERWHIQDWAASNGRENLHRIGGEPTWIQNPSYPACPDCHDVMAAIGQIAVEDLWNGAGIAYLLWCDRCGIGAVVYQQT